MEICEKLIENPLFFKRIYDPGPEIDSWWKTYLEMHPEESDQILRFKQRFNALGFSIEKLSEAEKKALVKKIMVGLETIDKKEKSRQSLIGMARYAAIALIFLSILDRKKRATTKSWMRFLYICQKFLIQNLQRLTIAIIK